jgi:soluble lytic murein transglycosylase-like protein
MRRIVPLILGATGVGFLVILFAARKRLMSAGAVISYEPTTPGGNYVTTVSIPKQLSLEIINSARKWANARGIPIQEVLATILVESSGNPRAWANKEKEDSRGLMQVNIRAWASLLSQNGMSVEDLWDIDKNIMIGTYIYAQYRKKVQDLLSQASCPAARSAPVATLTRLYYKGPAYVEKMIRECGSNLQALHPYKDAEKAVANWNNAMVKVSTVV